jgi:hemolysin III
MYHGERLNSFTHMLGAGIALAGFVVVVVFASLKGDVWKIVSFSIYGTSLFLLYLFSTLYHSTKGKLKAFFQKLDHIVIIWRDLGTRGHRDNPRLLFIRSTTHYSTHHLPVNGLDRANRD